MKFALATTVLAMAASAVSADNIPAVATNDGRFETLVAALGAADLVGTLDGEGPFTVFAPTDDAFAALPAELVPCLLRPESKDALTSILTYHVVGGKVMSTDLSDGMTAATVETSSVTITLGDSVKVNDSTVIIADVEADNGVIHVIDAVLVPPTVDVTAFLAACPKDDMEDESTMDESGVSTLTASAAMVGAGLVAALL